MKYDIDHIHKLLIEKIAGIISEDDNLLVERALENDGSVRTLWKVLSDQFNTLEGESFLKNINADDAWLKISAHLRDGDHQMQMKTVSFFKASSFRELVVAAIVLITIAISCYFLLGYIDNESRLTQSEISNKVVDREAGYNKVVLTLANGETIVLDSVESGILMKTEHIQVSKTANGQLLYQVTEDHSGIQSNGLNVITTPFGGQYQIILPDGSRVWLNTTSSLKFPTTFRGNKREVELIGEAYFEVTKKGVPFIVKSKYGEIEVLGTDFNVMAYEDELAMKTTLLEGSVRIVGAETGSRILKPGEQAIVDSSRIHIENVDTEAEIAWKNNLFQFSDTSIESIMRQASRWYNIEVKYAGPIPDRSFTGKISRKVDITEFLEMLKYTGVDFKLEENHILVL